MVSIAFAESSFRSLLNVHSPVKCVVWPCCSCRTQFVSLGTVLGEGHTLTDNEFLS